MAQKIEIEIKTDNPLEARAVKEHLQTLATAPVDVLERLAKLNTEKGHQALRSEFNWAIIKKFA